VLGLIMLADIHDSSDGSDGEAAEVEVEILHSSPPHPTKYTSQALSNDLLPRDSYPIKPEEVIEIDNSQSADADRPNIVFYPIVRCK